MANLSLTFVYPWFGAALLGAVLLLGAAVWYLLRVHRMVNQLTTAQHRAIMLPAFSWFRLVIRVLLLGGACMATIFALMRPQRIASTSLEQLEMKRDLVVAVDISRSMLVEDCGGTSRLECAKKKIKLLAAALKVERCALIVFSGAAFVQCPLTRDMAAFGLFVDALDVGVLSGCGTTSIAAALRAAAELFARAESAAQSKLVVLITDGEDFSTDIGQARTEAQKEGLQVSVLGIGSEEGGPIPLYNDAGTQIGHQRDAHDAVVISRLNRPLLASLTTMLNGRYCAVHAADHEDIAELMSWITLREVEQGAVTRQGAEELYMYFAGCAASMMVLSWLF